MNNNLIRFFYAIVLIFPFSLTSPVFAEDVVFYLNQGVGIESSISGEIQQFLRNGLMIQTPSGQIKTIPSDCVVRIQTNRPETYQEGLLRMERGEFSQAIPLLEKAFAQIEVPWLKTELLSNLIQCYTHLDKMEDAAMQYALLLQTEPQTAYYTAVPLIWTSAQGSSRMKQTAQNWIRQQNFPYVALLGASWLLVGENQKDAVYCLNSLVNSDDAILSLLAEMQLKRIQLTAITPELLLKQRFRIDSLPKELQFGPRFVTAQMGGRLSNPSAYISDFIAINYLQCADNKKTPVPLKERSLYSAGTALLQSGQKEEAFRVFTQLLQKFPDSNWAEQAKRSAEGNL